VYTVPNTIIRTPATERAGVIFGCRGRAVGSVLMLPGEISNASWWYMEGTDLDRLTVRDRLQLLLQKHLAQYLMLSSLQTLLMTVLSYLT